MVGSEARMRFDDDRFEWRLEQKSAKDFADKVAVLVSAVQLPAATIHMARFGIAAGSGGAACSPRARVGLRYRYKIRPLTIR